MPTEQTTYVCLKNIDKVETTLYEVFKTIWKLEEFILRIADTKKFRDY